MQTSVVRGALAYLCDHQIQVRRQKTRPNCTVVVGVTSHRYRAVSRGQCAARHPACRWSTWIHACPACADTACGNHEFERFQHCQRATAPQQCYI